MRFLHTRLYRIIENYQIPEGVRQAVPYAILSHTWLPSDRDHGVQEVVYQDMKTSYEELQNGKFKQAGWSKLKAFCDRAAGDGWEYAWMDTCCIDKESPSDTEEAINAMFRWYQDAEICYAYLFDVDIDKTGQPSREVSATVESTGLAEEGLRSSFTAAKWFTRGWTLQELLAPDYLIFVDHQWRDIGSREMWAGDIYKATNIIPHHLSEFDACSLATKLSWASGRETTREEDKAYSLLGLFNISMPLIYGEGPRAFLRLQYELIKNYDDMSIFAWKAPFVGDGATALVYESTRPVYGLLAPSPSFFNKSSDFERPAKEDTPSFDITNRGIRLEGTVWHAPANEESPLSHFVLEVARRTQKSDQLGEADKATRLGIYFRPEDATEAGPAYRIHHSHLLEFPQSPESQGWKRFSSVETFERPADAARRASGRAQILSLNVPSQITIDADLSPWRLHGAAFTFRHQIRDYPMPKLANNTFGLELHLVRGLNDGDIYLYPEDRLIIPISLKVDVDGSEDQHEFSLLLRHSQTTQPSVGIWPGECSDNILDKPTFPLKANAPNEKYAICVKLLPRPKHPGDKAVAVTISLNASILQYFKSDDRDSSRFPDSLHIGGPEVKIKRYQLQLVLEGGSNESTPQEGL
ncbi:HET domain protein [Aspergillus fischeri NRRL 181]|uniref:HET domain protein n=1 Tax=Neosartorya fischeri (strain ATCC 1020 / DSM 3700 / CBS 544.65 / FGSC A1164 / JCM 1740 / NRRL 181 / WB 181) TaxID=331117 RepID=A1DDA0_NEOFI|nr:HET domain protein [Aspergillus fischeri NRRL 181]EAW17357.1 HET domain protein [Aspergillus fischeri NRRL 181]KAG2014487.1 hypothetical protein GB937_006712 [Aspergillus fischeri]